MSILGRMLMTSIRTLGSSLSAQVCLSIVAQQHPGQARVGSRLLPLPSVASEHTARSCKHHDSRSLSFSRRTANQGQVAEKQSQFALLPKLPLAPGVVMSSSACQAYRSEFKNSFHHTVQVCQAFVPLAPVRPDISTDPWVELPIVKRSVGASFSLHAFVAESNFQEDEVLLVCDSRALVALVFHEGTVHIQHHSAAERHARDARCRMTVSGSWPMHLSVGEGRIVCPFETLSDPEDQ